MFASIAQEFIRGVIVRRKQTGSDPVTSLIGLVFMKRRKYGGYVIHLGVAMMFVGFAGKAYDRMIDRTLDKPAIADGRASHEADKWFAQNVSPDGSMSQIPKDTRSAFPFDGYVFLYENLIHTSDDHKDAVTAQVSRSGRTARGSASSIRRSGDYHKAEAQQTTEVAITVRFTEDVYIVLTGYDMESQQANFRVYINPMISWVWISFLQFTRVRHRDLSDPAVARGSTVARRRWLEGRQHRDPRARAVRRPHGVRGRAAGRARHGGAGHGRGGRWLERRRTGRPRSSRRRR